jgi:hypothetical protein
VKFKAWIRCIAVLCGARLQHALADDTLKLAIGQRRPGNAAPELARRPVFQEAA